MTDCLSVNQIVEFCLHYLTMREAREVADACVNRPDVFSSLALLDGDEPYQSGLEVAQHMLSVARRSRSVGAA